MTMMMPELHAGRGAEVGPLTVFPVWSGAAAPTGLVTGKAAQVEVTEGMGGPGCHTLAGLP